VLDLAGTVDFGTGLELHAFATLSSENMSPVQKRLYRERGFDKARVRDMARLVPADAGLFLMGNGDVGDLLRTALESAEDAMISNLEDQIRSVWGYADYNPLVDDVDAAFKGRFAFCVRDNDYRDEGEAGPPHDDTPVFAWALILLPDDRRKIEEVQTRITNRQADFLIKGREPGSKGVFENRTTGGGRLYEYWSEFIPGTGHLATLELGDFFLISNNNLMLSHMEQTYVDRTNRYAALADVPLFDVNVGTGLASTNLLLWLNPREVHDTMEAFARRLSQMNLAIDWDVERPRLERQVVAEHFPGADPDNLTPDQAQQLEILVEPVLERFEEEQFERQAPALRAEYERRIDALEILSGGLLELFVDQKRAELLVRLITPLEA
jgi:hypothetical protein